MHLGYTPNTHTMREPTVSNLFFFLFLSLPSKGVNPSSMLQRLSDGMQVGEGLDMTYPPCDYIPYNVEHIDEDRDGDRYTVMNLSSL